LRTSTSTRVQRNKNENAPKENVTSLKQFSGEDAPPTKKQGLKEREKKTFHSHIES